MTRDTVLAISFILAISLLVAHIVLRLFKKSIKLRFTLIILTVAFMSITVILSKQISLFGVIIWALGELAMDFANKKYDQVEQYKNEIVKSNIFPQYLQTKQEIMKGKIRVTEVPYDAVQLL